MAKRQFDVAPVLDEEGALIGVFRATSAPAEGQVSSAVEPLSVHMLVSADATVSELAQRLMDHSFVFVVEGGDVARFVTPADLGSAPARSYYYFLLAALEMKLYRYLCARFPDQSVAIGKLPSGRQCKHAELVKDLTEKDSFIDALSAVSVGDLITIAGKEPAFRKAVRDGGCGWREAKKGIDDFRNEVMHPSRERQWLRHHGDPTHLVTVERRIRALMIASQGRLSRLLPQSG